jgi:hypothetical protein
MFNSLKWRLKQRLARPARFYGGEGTIHQTGWLDVATHHGTVVSVWFRCQNLPFNQTEVGADRAASMERMHERMKLTGSPTIEGVEVWDGVAE